MTYFPELADPAIKLDDLDKAVRKFMHKYLTTALIRNNSHMQRAAEELGIHRNTLTRLCKQTGVVTGSRRGRALA
jgi:DNA-binding NtrC family response regulator